MKKLSVSIICFIATTLFIVMFSVNSHSQENSPPIQNVTQIETFLKKPTSKTNLLDTKLFIDKMIDPRVDVLAVRDEISTMTADIQKMLKSDSTEWDKVTALRQYIYDSGEWNDHKPFSYDLNDPQGGSRTSRLLHNYLKTRKGNCVSMPLLHAILGQELGLDMSVTTAPLHMFVKYTNKEGQTINIEATSGGHPARDAWYQQNLPMLPIAVKNGVFLKTLSHEETIAVLGQDLVHHLTQNKQSEEAIQVSEKLIELFPNYAPLYISRGSAFYQIIETKYKEKYPNANDIPKDLKPEFQYLMQQNMVSFKIAEELGWQDPDELLESRVKEKK